MLLDMIMETTIMIRTMQGLGRGVQQSNFHTNRGFKMCDKPKLKALFNWITSAKHANWAYQIKKQWTPFSTSVYRLVMVLTIAIRANIVVPSGDSIHSYYQTTLTKNCYSLGLKYLDTPVNCLTGFLSY